VVYALRPPNESFLENAYSESEYDSDEAADCAALSYIQALSPHIEELEHRRFAVDVGAGNGALLPYLEKLNFSEVLGIEPSRAAIESADMSIRSCLKQEMFTKDSFSGREADLICSFMTLEHLPDPGRFVGIAYEKLAPGGLLAVVVHNYEGLLNRILGKRSPIIDLEHLQLFNRESIHYLLKSVGLKRVDVQPLVNSYPIHYWVRLLPLPNRLKAAILGLPQMKSLFDKRVSLNVGNLFAVGYK